MAQPIPLEIPTSDPIATFQDRLQHAPAQHGEALLSALDLIQALHDAGTLDLLRGLLASKDKVMDVAVTAADLPGSVRAIQNLLLMFNMLSEIDPEVLRAFTETLPTVMKEMIREPESPGLWRLLSDFFWNPNFRHGLAVINTMLEELGRGWSKAQNR
jgi:uncharacterized protein YjgD (DUF1641 family)